MGAATIAVTDATFDREVRHGPPKGRWIRLHYIPVRSEAGVVAATVVLMDIQHLKDAQDAIAQRERQLSLITDTIGFPVTYIDREGVVRFANAFGYNPDIARNVNVDVRYLLWMLDQVEGAADLLKELGVQP